MATEEKEMSFLDHVEVLRWHLVRSSAVIIAFAAVAFFMKDFIFDVIIFAPKNPDFITYRFFCEISRMVGTDGLCIDDIPFTFQSLAMGEQFNVHIWTSITAGFILAFPFVIWEFWKFISPGLYEKERKGAKTFIVISSFLFFWDNTPIFLSPLFAILMALKDLSLEMLIGIITPGNRTVFFKGSIGNISGKSSFNFLSSSSPSIENKGKNSPSSSFPPTIISSNMLMYDFVIKLCHHDIA